LLFQASLTWENSLTFDELDLSATNTPWDVRASGSSLAQFVLVFAQHTVGAHINDSPFGGNLQILFTAITPGVGGSTQSVLSAHPASHSDRLTVTITPTVAGVSSTIDIMAEHQAIPEPSTLALGALGACLLFAGGRRSLRR
jgi:hypothetical protein